MVYFERAWRTILSFLSATTLFLLSFFALETDTDGLYVIKKKSLYGKVFLLVSLLKEAFWHKEELSFCRIFWQTNLFIFVWCFSLAVLISLLIQAHEAGLVHALIVRAVSAIGIAVVIGLLIALSAFSDWLRHREIEKSLRDFEERKRVGHPHRKKKTIPPVPWYVKIAMFAATVVLVLILAIQSFGAWNVLLGIAIAVGLTTIMMLGCCVFGIIMGSLELAYRAFTKTLVYEQFLGFYRFYLCPRIRVE